MAGDRTPVLCADVMCGRGIDQVLAHPCNPRIYEEYMRSAEGYVLLAERVNGPIPRRNGPSYVWGSAVEQLERMQPDTRIINLETAATRSDDRANKGINYRISPENAECLTAARIDSCVLANNHVLDWGRAGLKETLATLQELNIIATGAGCNDREARAPAVLNLAKARLLIFSFGSTSSGIPPDWAATSGEGYRRPGQNRSTAASGAWWPGRRRAPASGLELTLVPHPCCECTAAGKLKKPTPTYASHGLSSLLCMLS